MWSDKVELDVKTAPNARKLKRITKRRERRKQTTKGQIKSVSQGLCIYIQDESFRERKRSQGVAAR